jgi:hypothetical protein
MCCDDQLKPQRKADVRSVAKFAIVDVASAMGIRVSNYRKKMNVLGWALTAAAVGIVLSKYVLSDESPAQTVALIVSGIVFIAGLLITFLIGCGNCGSGWYELPSKLIRRELERRRSGLSNVRFDHNEVPERCPVCNAKL